MKGDLLGDLTTTPALFLSCFTTITEPNTQIKRQQLYRIWCSEWSHNVIYKHIHIYSRFYKFSRSDSLNHYTSGFGWFWLKPCRVLLLWSATVNTFIAKKSTVFCWYWLLCSFSVSDSPPRDKILIPSVHWSVQFRTFHLESLQSTCCNLSCSHLSDFYESLGKHFCLANAYLKSCWNWKTSVPDTVQSHA